MIYRVDVFTDSPQQSLRAEIQDATGIDPGDVRARRIFLIDADATQQQIDRASRELLSDAIVENFEIISQPRSEDRWSSRIEVHLKPGVMDPVAASTEMALRDMEIPVREVRTGRAYLLDRRIEEKDLSRIASRVLANGVIESIHFAPYLPSEFAHGHEQLFKLRTVPLRGFAEEQLTKLSREAHLFLSLEEMRAIQNYFAQQDRDPTDIELETLAQTWSEHCVHKTLKSAVDVFDESGNKLRHYDNLIKETIFGSTQQLNSKLCLSVFKDNAGVIAFDDVDAVCFKVETHNHPSAIEPYGGAATGIGGCIRDVMGTGLSARPIANTDVFCVGFPDQSDEGTSDPSSLRRSVAPSLPSSIIHPKRILQQIVAGVRDYGNRMGIPTINGAVYFDDNYIGNPLVFCGCVGLIPRDKIHKRVNPGDAIVLMGGRTGRDGIHGATFSSAELTDTHADEFSHAVQIGNAITQKKMLDVIMQARDRSLFTAITDCGAGGLSSAVGEMGEKVGASVELDRVPLKYAGLRYDEIWISEAQERMVLAVARENVDALLKLSREEDVEATVIGEFGTEKRELILNYKSKRVGTLSMEFLHEGIPMPRRRAVLRDSSATKARGSAPGLMQMRDCLLEKLSHPNIASKHWIIRQYDHEVQGGSVVKPLVGPQRIGPSDASVVRPKLDSLRGVVLACGFAPQVRDPYDMALASIDEAIRNAVCVGANLDKLAILDNFCWPSVDSDESMGNLVRACEACRDAALAFKVPFISGKDSLNNQFTDTETGRVIRIPNTLLISAIGVIDDVRSCVTMDLKRPGSRVYLIAAKDSRDLNSLNQTHRFVSSLIAQKKVLAAHDVSDGGGLIAAAEMCIASGLGMTINAEIGFDEQPGGYLVETTDAITSSSSVTVTEIATVQSQPIFKLAGSTEISIDELTGAWRGTLDW